MKKDKFPKLQQIMLAAERHSRWGIGVVAFLLAFFIHAFFLFGLKINIPPIGDWQPGAPLVWVQLPKEAPAKKSVKITLWKVKIKGHLINHININRSDITKISDTKNTLEFNVKKLFDKCNPVRAAIFEVNIKDGQKAFSLIQSSGCDDFNSLSTDYINSLIVKPIPSKERCSSIVTVTLIKQ